MSNWLGSVAASNVLIKKAEQHLWVMLDSATDQPHTLLTLDYSGLCRERGDTTIGLDAAKSKGLMKEFKYCGVTLFVVCFSLLIVQFLLVNECITPNKAQYKQGMPLEREI